MQDDMEISAEVNLKHKYIMHIKAKVPSPSAI